MSAESPEADLLSMARALELARRGEGFVEPNPMVGCVLVRDEAVVGEGWHQRFGGPHAEVEALNVAGTRARRATAYVTLEPCCHFGKTPPCTQALIAAGVRRVVAAGRDPFPEVAGKGLAELAAAGIEVEVGLMEAEAARLNAPYLKRVRTGRPWVIAKWAMTLDGKIATRTGDSRWISGEASRAIVHQLRGRMDAIIVGRGTVAADDPLLTARPPGPRIATRVVLDSQASLRSDSQLIRTIGDAPVLVAVSEEARAAERERLSAAGCDVFVTDGVTPPQWLVKVSRGTVDVPPRVHTEARLMSLLNELGRRQATNVLVEGGAELLGCFFDVGAVDEVHVFIAPKLSGGTEAPSPIAGLGVERIADSLRLEDDFEIRRVGEDLYIHGRVRRVE